MFCKSEYIYSEAIGEELFFEQASARIEMFLDGTEVVFDPNSRRRPDKKGILSKEEARAFEQIQKLIENENEE